MSKFLKRFGTQTQKFVLEVFISKVDLKSIKPIYISVLLERGDHKKETTPALVEEGKAVFDEKLRVMATMYYDKKKNLYQEKDVDAFLKLLVVIDKMKTMIGSSKIDLADMLNKNVLEQESIIPVGNCKDKEAKFHTKIKMIKLGGREDNENGYVSLKIVNKSDLSQEASHDSNGIENRRSKSPQAESNSDKKVKDDDKSRSKTPDIFQNNGLRRSLFGDMNESNQTISEIQDKVLELKEEATEIEGSENEKKTESQTNLETEEKSKTKKNVDVKVNDHFNWNETSSISNIEEFTWNNVSKDFFKKGEFNWNEKNDEDNIDNLKKKLNSAKEELFNNNLEYEDLKSKYEKVRSELENVSKEGPKTITEKKLESSLRLHKERIQALEESNARLASENSDLKESIEKLTQEIDTTKNELSTKELKEKNFDDYEQTNTRKFHDMSKNLERNEAKYKQEAQNLELQIEELQMQIRTLNFEKMQATSKFENQELLISSLENEISILKSVCSTSNPAEFNLLKQQVEECERCHSNFDETVKQKLETLEKENDELKQELGNCKIRMSTQRIDMDTEVERLQQENEAYQQNIKDLSHKLMSKLLDEKTIEEQLQMISSLANSKSKLENELLKAKMGWANANIELENNQIMIQGLNDEIAKYKEDLLRLHNDLEITQSELFKAKTKLGEVFNLILEYGKKEIIDMVEAVISNE